MDKYTYIDQLTADTQQIIAIVQQEFLPLTEEEVKHTPAPGKWGVAECIKHLLLADQHYMDALSRAFEKHPKRPENTPFKPGVLGEKLTRMMKPQEARIPIPMGTLRRFDPEKARVPRYEALEGKEVLTAFLQQQSEWLEMLEKARDYSWGIRIPSALGPIIRFKMGDALRFVTAHNQRHVLQAQRALQA